MTQSRGTASLRTTLRHLLAGGCASLMLATTVQALDLKEQLSFNIAPQELTTALVEFSRQINAPVVSSTNTVDRYSSRGIHGTMSVQAALRLLLEGTELSYRITESGAIAIGSFPTNSTNPTTTSISVNTPQGMRVAAADVEAAANAPSLTRSNEVGETGERKRIVLEEVVVTGSHIRGAENLSSPVIRFDREDIERSGYATTQQLIQSLPQNLNNVSDTTFSNSNGGPGLTYDGSGLNLRGLGSDSTLVLLNGRRIAPIGQGDFVDVSLIPLSAIQRVEVLTDGASAIYGADAVGGVVNMVLRTDFDGAETSVRYGSVTEGSHEELQAGQTIGRSWDSGNALVSYEYYRRTALDAADRDFIKPTQYLGSIELIPGQTRHGVFATLSQGLSHFLKLSSDFFYSERESGFVYESSGFPLDANDKVKQYGGSLELTWDLSNEWQVRVSGLLNESKAERQTYLSGSPWADNSNELRLSSFDLTADGGLGSAPGGEIRLAAGGQFRNERFSEGYAINEGTFKRDIAAFYAELLIPWVGAGNRRLGIEHLQTSFAGRLENYSDFGSTFNPKFGLSWAPVAGLNLRGSWGTSFKAPLLTQMNPALVSAAVYEGVVADRTGTTTTLYLQGTGVDLEPEESTNWTVGFDLWPGNLSGFNLAATYFHIDYEERIKSPFPAGYEIWDVLLDPVYESIVTREPDVAYISTVLAHPRTSCRSAAGVWGRECPPADQIRAVVDERLQNLAGVRVSGIDVALGYRWTTAIGRWNWQFSGTRLLESKEQLVPSAPETNQLDDVWRPVDLRLRNSLSYSRGSLDTTAVINFVDSYHDRRGVAGPSGRRVDSWTTVDLTVRYDIGALFARNGLKQTTVSLSAANLLDRDPPYIESSLGLHFDGANAHPRGRFISAQVRASW